MTRHSLFLRLFLGNLLIVVVAVAVGAVMSYRAANVQYLGTANAYQDNLALLAAQHLGDGWPLPDEDIDRFCKRFLDPSSDGAGDERPTVQRAVPARLTVIARDGRVLGDSQGDPKQMANHKSEDRPEVLGALGGRPSLDVRRSDTLATPYRYVARPIHSRGEVVGAVRVATPVITIVESQALLRDGILWASLAAVVSFGLLGLLINWIWYAPLRSLGATARHLASGDLSARAGVRGPAELARLGLALNAMRDSLARQIGTITAQRENLRQVVAALREGVVAIDAQGRIVLANRAAVDLLAPDQGEVIGRRIEDAVRVAEVVEAWHEAADSGLPVSRQVETDWRGRRRDLDVHVSPLAASEAEAVAGVLVVRDVTDLVRTAAMKTEFVANASHELRTPLATLRAAVESLEGGGHQDAEMLAKAVAILKRHLTRLENLTLDLLDLHAVETARGGGESDEIRLGSLEQWARQQFDDLASDKGVALEFHVPAGDDVFTSDRKLVGLILHNLLENAIKFTPSGGRVVCRIERQADAVVLGVSDTGIGISREDRTRVFERFFQADAARSGDAKVRGTGLGLAIVKHAAERLGATVDLQSELGKGTTVTVRVPDR
jgi:two-component system phosphate regulon sensor histidine kinase PhoR